MRTKSHNRPKSESFSQPWSKAAFATYTGFPRRWQKDFNGERASRPSPHESCLLLGDLDQAMVGGARVDSIPEACVFGVMARSSKR